MFVDGSTFRFVIDAARRWEKEIKGAQKKTKLLNQQTRSGRQTSIVRLSINSEGFTRLVRKTTGNVAVPLSPRVV